MMSCYYLFVLISAIAYVATISDQQYGSPLWGSSGQMCPGDRGKDCVRKCCPFDEVVNTLNLEISCQPQQAASRKQFHSNYLNVEHYYVAFGYRCQNIQEQLIKLRLQGSNIVFQPDGQLTAIGQNFTFERYCLDWDNDTQQEIVFVCYADEEASTDEQQQTVPFVGMIISMPFLLATFIVYLLLPERNLHMLVLMCYVLSLCIAYLLLVTIQLNLDQFENIICKVIGYACLFSFMVSFLWMNVICIDMWFTFSGLKSRTDTKSSRRKRFIFYSIYTGSMAVLHFAIVFAIDMWGDSDAWWTPGVGVGQCFVRAKMGQLLYLYGPMSVLITLNVILFVCTSIRIRSLRKDTAILKKTDSQRHTYESNKQKFNLYVKLLFAMGINWSMEIISWAMDWKIGHIPPYIWYLTDFCNAVYGVFIFFIFVFKKNIWLLLQKRYHMIREKMYFGREIQNDRRENKRFSTTCTSLAFDADSTCVPMLSLQ